MLGIDLTKITRFEDATKKFVNKILHPIEISEYEKSENKPLYLATRWAIKEALYKADNEKFSFSDTLIKKVNRKYKLKGYKISTSKEEDFVIAVVQKEQ